MSFKIATATASSRKNSEDRLAVHHVPGGVVVVVADGAGGTSGGGWAADLALWFVDRGLGGPGFNPFVARSWEDLLVEADDEIERDTMAGETTSVIVAITDDGGIVGASTGDSGAIVVADDGTIDDLTEQRKRKRLGSGRAAPVAFERSVLEGVLVVATDGLFNYARPEVIARVVGEHQDLDAAARALVDCVRLRSGDLQDDVAVVLVRRARA